MGKSIKTIKTLVRELNKDIRDNNKSIKSALAEIDYETVIDLQRDNNTLEYVLELIAGDID